MERKVREQVTPEMTFAKMDRYFLFSSQLYLLEYKHANKTDVNSIFWNIHSYFYHLSNIFSYG